MKIIEINRQALADINKANQPFEIIGRIRPSFANTNCIEKRLEPVCLYRGYLCCKVCQRPGNGHRLNTKSHRMGERLQPKGAGPGDAG